GICVGLFTFARSTVTPFCNMGVITMKMINSTSMTSTMGVTLMLELTFAPSSLFDIAITVLLPHSAFKPRFGGRSGRDYFRPDLSNSSTDAHVGPDALVRAGG